MLRSAISQSIVSIREIAICHVERMAVQLKQRYRYLGVLKKTILDALASSMMCLQPKIIENSDDVG